MSTSPIEFFIKKYRAAISGKSTEIRLSIDEATAIITAFAEQNTATNKTVASVEQLNKKLDQILNAAQSTPSGGFDGGTF